MSEIESHWSDLDPNGEDKSGESERKENAEASPIQTLWTQARKIKLAERERYRKRQELELDRVKRREEDIQEMRQEAEKSQRKQRQQEGNGFHVRDSVEERRRKENEERASLAPTVQLGGQAEMWDVF